tara:strand:+ start:42 stop:752 length:711 start_codon:yes stop_codon:yes gene_type:complete
MKEPKNFVQGEIISYDTMCKEENNVRLERGMHFQFTKSYSVLLASTMENSPYEDEIINNGKTFLYEGHDVHKTKKVPNPKNIDQPMYLKSGEFTQNGLFFISAQQFKAGIGPAEIVRIYQKIKKGIWSFAGNFYLNDSSYETINDRKVFKFMLDLIEDTKNTKSSSINKSPGRLIPSEIKVEVYKRDKGRCVECGESSDLHYDHILPYSKGGSSTTSENIQLLCARHNLSKSNKII